MKSQDGSPPPRRWLLMPLVWIGLLVPWTWALLLPLPAGTAPAFGGAENVFTIGKTLHVSAYAVLAYLATRITDSRPLRAALLLLLLLHGGVAEYLQQFVGRGSSPWDFGLDALGVAIGMGFAWLLGRRRGHALGKTPQEQLERDSPSEHRDASHL